VWADPARYLENQDTTTLSTLEVHKGKIAGLEVMSSTIAQLETKVNTLASSSAVINESTSSANLLTQTFGNIIIQGQSIIHGVVTFMNDISVEGVAKFLSSVIFDGQVIFNGELYVTTDTAGKAIIPVLSNAVEVKFKKPYKNPPVVTISLEFSESTDSAFFSEAIQAAVTEVTQDGFKIVLNSPVPRELTYNWHAFISQETITTVGSIDEAFLTSQEATDSATITEIRELIAQAAASSSGQVQATTSAVISPTPTPSLPSTLPNTITTTQNQLMYKEPTINTSTVTTIPKGYTLPFSYEYQGWYFVQFNNVSGWITSPSIIKN
jgi:hypothetical protein